MNAYVPSIYIQNLFPTHVSWSMRLTIIKFLDAMSPDHIQELSIHLRKEAEKSDPDPTVLAVTLLLFKKADVKEHDLSWDTKNAIEKIRTLYSVQILNT